MPTVKDLEDFLSNQAEGQQGKQRQDTEKLLEAVTQLDKAGYSKAIGDLLDASKKQAEKDPGPGKDKSVAAAAMADWAGKVDDIRSWEGKNTLGEAIQVDLLAKGANALNRGDLREASADHDLAGKVDLLVKTVDSYTKESVKEGQKKAPEVSPPEVSSKDLSDAYKKITEVGVSTVTYLEAETKNATLIAASPVIIPALVAGKTDEGHLVAQWGQEVVKSLVAPEIPNMSGRKPGMESGDKAREKPEEPPQYMRLASQDQPPPRDKVIPEPKRGAPPAPQGKPTENPLHKEEDFAGPVHSIEVFQTKDGRIFISEDGKKSEEHKFDQLTHHFATDEKGNYITDGNTCKTRAYLGDNGQKLDIDQAVKQAFDDKKVKPLEMEPEKKPSLKTFEGNAIGIPATKDPVGGNKPLAADNDKNVHEKLDKQANDMKPQQLPVTQGQQPASPAPGGGTKAPDQPAMGKR